MMVVIIGVETLIAFGTRFQSEKPMSGLGIQLSPSHLPELYRQGPVLIEGYYLPMRVPPFSHFYLRLSYPSSRFSFSFLFSVSLFHCFDDEIIPRSHLYAIFPFFLIRGWFFLFSGFNHETPIFPFSFFFSNRSIVKE